MPRIDLVKTEKTELLCKVFLEYRKIIKLNEKIMKRNLFYLFVFALSCTFLSSCSDDDESVNSKNLIAEISGTYLGDLAVTLDGLPLGQSTQQIYVTEDGESTVKLELKDFVITIQDASLPVGNIVVPGIDLAGDQSKVELKETNVVINHPDLQELQVKVIGSVTGENADLHIVVWAKELNQNIDVTFNGKKTSEEVKDNAMEMAAWYARKDLTITGVDIEAKDPTDGIEVTYVGFNKIGIKSFSLSCYANDKAVTRSINIASANLLVGADGVSIEPVKQILTHKTYGDAELDLTGKFVNGVLTLNMTVTQESTKVVYVYTGEKKMTGATLDKMTVDGQIVAIQPEIGEQEDGFDIKKADVIFFVNSDVTSDQLKALVPQFEFSAGATITLNGSEYTKGSPVDFTTTQLLNVKSESGRLTNNYNLVAQKMNDFKSNFDTWETKNKNLEEFNQYEEPANGWGTSNEGVKWIKIYPELYGPKAPYAVIHSDDAKSGKAARLETLNTTGQAGFGVYMPAIPVVTSGSAFTGTFKVNISNTLKSTLFGYPCLKQPVSFKGSYKYTAGKVYYYCAQPTDKANEVVPDKDKKDLPALNAVLYEVNSYAFDFLDGTNLLTSDKIVAIASVDGKEQSSYADFDVKFSFKSGKTFDSTKKYKLAIVCSSSKDGDKFSGAPGSVLFVDNVEVTF